MRYSDDPYFEGKHFEARDQYAATSWKSIMTSGCAVDENTKTEVVQAMSLLAIIDSAAGRRRAAWVKIGLGVRISQDLHLMIEPDPTLPVVDQEERRRLFWSLYLLDRFVSCSRQRPPAILDNDCQVQLPCDEASFRQGVLQKTDLLSNVGAGNEESAYRPGQFALLVMMGRTLGRCARYMLDNRQSSKETAPWNPQSEYTAITSNLLCCESYLEIGTSLKDYIQRDMLTSNGSSVDQEPAGHVIFSRMLFHLCHCLLNHPFLLRMRVDATTAKAPATWFLGALRLGLEHAGNLISVFGAAKEAGFTASTSFYGYCLLVAGTIHALYTHSDTPGQVLEATEYLSSGLEYLDDIARYWNNTKLVVSGLRTFWSISSGFAGLLQPGPLQTPLDPSDLQTLWSVVDYSIISDPEKSLSKVNHAPAPPSPWREEGGGIGSESTTTRESIYPQITMGGMNSASASARLPTTADNLSLHNYISFFADSQSAEDFINDGHQSFVAMDNSNFSGPGQEPLPAIQ